MRLLFRMLYPVKIPSINNDTAYRGAVAANKFGQRMHNNCRAMVKWATGEGRGRIVHNKGYAACTANLGNFSNGKGYQFRVRECFPKIGSRSLIT